MASNDSLRAVANVNFANSWETSSPPSTIRCCPLITRLLVPTLRSWTVGPDSEGPSKGLTLRSLQSAPFMAQPWLPEFSRTSSTLESRRSTHGRRPELDPTSQVARELRAIDSRGRQGRNRLAEELVGDSAGASPQHRPVAAHDAN